MPILFLIVGILFIMVAIKGNYNSFASLITSDLTGSGSFFVWVGAIMGIAIITSVIGLPKSGKALIALLVVVFVISENGFFSKLSSALTNLTAPQATPSAQTGSAATVPGTSTPSNPGS